MHKLKSYIKIVFLPFRYRILMLLLCIGLVCTSLQKTASYIPIIQNKNYLAKYGEYIFNREPCMACHSLEIETAEDRFSLDGLGGKYNNFYLFLLLQDPNQVKIATDMPSFPHLFKNKINIDTFRSKLGFTTTEWEILLQQADSLSNDLNSTPEIRYSSKFNRSESIALIAYLQSIPASKEQRKIDSLKNVEYTNAVIKLKNLILKPESSIYKKPYTQEEIVNGKNYFQSSCAACHRSDGGGSIGPNLTDDFWLHGDSESEIAHVIAFGGREGKGMIPWGQLLTEQDFRNLLAYIQSIRGTHPENGRPPEGTRK